MSCRICKLKVIVLLVDLFLLSADAQTVSYIWDDCAIVSFALVNSMTRQDIGPLPDVLDLSMYPVNASFNIRVDIDDSECGQPIRSVLVKYNSTTSDDAARSFCEEWKPYSVFGDSNAGGPDIANFSKARYKRHVFPNVSATATVEALPYFVDGCDTQLRGKDPVRQTFKILANECSAWSEMGKDVKGEKNLVQFGGTVVMSGDASTVAVPYGQELNSSITDPTTGHLKILSWDNHREIWKQRGQVLDADFSANMSSAVSSVTMSDDGHVVVMSSLNLVDDGSKVQRWEWDTSGESWVRVGQTLEQSQGSVVMMSGDASILAVGSLFGVGSELFQWSSTSQQWSKLGQLSDKFMAMSADGTTICEQYKANGANFVKVWRWNGAMGSFEQFGNELVYDTTSQFGGSLNWYPTSIVLSANGETIAVGLYLSFSIKLKVEVYTFDKESNTWEQLGSTIEPSSDSSYNAVMSQDGQMIAVGNAFFEETEKGRLKQFGRVTVWRFDTKVMSWKQVGTDVVGNQAFDGFGQLNSVALSANGRTLGVGAYRYSHPRGEEIGQVRVFQLLDSTCD